MRALILIPLALLASGCVARTAATLISIPVKAASAGVDAVITTQAEADQRRGRQIREEEQRLGREARRRDREAGAAAAGQVPQ
ncbi:MAG TPA: hypothetical protein VN231_12390 [Allosphingosinicella sp.]|nr:hypothetical protein [Allosphingosinicella sp.]